MRALARAVVLAGAIGVGWVLFSAAPRELVLVYDLSAHPGASAIEVELRRGAEVMRRADIRVQAGSPVRHPVKLPDGKYELAYQIATPGGAVRGMRTLEVDEAGTIVLPLGR